MYNISCYVLVTLIFKRIFIMAKAIDPKVKIKNLEVAFKGMNKRIILLEREMKKLTKSVSKCLVQKEKKGKAEETKKKPVKKQAKS